MSGISRMMKRLISMLLMITFFLGIGLRSGALEWTINPEEKRFSIAAEQKYPGWKVTWVSWYRAGGQDYYEMTLMRISEGMLQTGAVFAKAEDSIAGNWTVYDNAPVPLSADGEKKANDILDKFVLSPTRYRDAGEFLKANSLIQVSASNLLNENEKLVSLQTYSDYLAGVAQNEAGLYSLRIADWNGTDYRKPTATSWEKCISINEVHSTDGYLEIYTSSSEDCLMRGNDGLWRLEVHTPEDGDRYFLTQEGIIDAFTNDYDPYYSNDAFHYGTPSFPIALPELVFTEIPSLEEALSLLDASGWACIKTEGAALRHQPEGEVSAYCFCRAPGRVLDKVNGWTLLQIGSDEFGMNGWLRNEDLAFGADIESVTCSFPSFDRWRMEDTAFAADICQQLNEDFLSMSFWLIGKTPEGDWLALIDGRLIRTVSSELIGTVSPARHWWEDEEIMGLPANDSE